MTSAGGSRKSTATGRCLCGAVRYRVFAPLRPVSACHCSQCRRQHGALGCYSGDLPTESVDIEGGEHLRWYQSSASARRGFCGRCGSKLFWQALDRRSIDIAAGSLDLPTGLTLDRHIFVADKGDYYQIADDLPQFPGNSSS
jgi:hypothetical protein